MQGDMLNNLRFEIRRWKSFEKEKEMQYDAKSRLVIIEL